MNVAELLEDKRVCICAGSGGVGKTTTSAAIAAGLAAEGARVVVVTIDPARRLANALGLEELDNEPHLVDPALFDAEGVEMKGELWAMMLDPKRTFDEIIDRVAPSPEARDEVYANRIYQQISTAVAGSQEFTAMAKLQELRYERDFDVLVLDTPPSRNALDFLDAPDRLVHFLEGRALQVFLKPAGIGGRIIGKGTGVVFSVLKRVTGVDLLEDLSVFFRSLGGMIDGFRDRAAAVSELLGDAQTTFLVVTSPEREPIDEAIFFRRKLAEARMPFGGVVVNRVHHDGLGDADLSHVRAELPDSLSDALAGRVAANLRDFHVLAERDDANVDRLRRELDADRLLLVPHLDDDVHDVGGLLKIGRYLFASGAEREAMRDEALA